MSIRSLSQYRKSLVEFVKLLPARLDAPGDDERRLRIALGTPAMLEEIPRPGLWKKLLIGAALVIFASAGATAVAAFHEVDKVVEALDQSPSLKLKGLAQTDPGEPQTLMILGSDRRPKDNVEGGSGARSDTIMLVRLTGEGRHGAHVAAA